MKLTSANKGADALAPHTEGRRYVATPSAQTASTGSGNRSINWTRSESGGSWSGTDNGGQRFTLIPDGRGTWSLFGLDHDGVGHVLEVEQATEWSAMAAALEYVDPPVGSIFAWVTLALIVGTMLTLAVKCAPL